MFEILVEILVGVWNALLGFFEWLAQFFDNWIGLLLFAVLVSVVVSAGVVTRRLKAIRDSANESASRSRAIQTIIEEKIQGYVGELLHTRKYLQKLEDKLEKEKEQ